MIKATMKLFVDSAKLDNIKDAAKSGLLDGVTTNPSLMKQAVEQLHDEEGEDIDLEEYHRENT